MPTYTYTARTLAGEQKTGTAEASDTHELARILREQGLLLIDTQREGQRARRSLLVFKRLTEIFGIPLSEKMIFARYLSVMITSGVDLPRALGVLAHQTQHKKFSLALEDIGQSVIKGTSFSDALKTRPDAFSELFVAMVEVGEESGKLDEVLKIVAEQMEKEHTLRARLRGAMMYPAIVILVMFVVGIFMMATVVPQLASVYREVGAELPPMTQIVIGIGEGAQKFWFLFPVVIAAVVLGSRFFMQLTFGKRAVALLLLRVPMFSSIVSKVASAQTSRTLGALIEAGVPIVRGLTICAHTVGNYYFRASLESAASVVQKGTSISEALRRDAKLWPPLVIELFAVGEETGKLGEVLEKLAAFYEEEVDQATRNLSTVVEPLLMVAIGVSVGFFAVAMLQPMYSLVGAIQ